MSKFYGKYRGVVTDITDPLSMGRIRAKVPDILGSLETGWALPCLPFAGAGMGFFALPKVGSFVWMEFEQGDIDYPIWSGCFFGSPKDLPTSALGLPGKKVLLQTAGGSSLVIDDTPGTGGVTVQTASGDKLVISAQGITLQTAAGQKLVLGPMGVEVNNSQGGSIKMTGPKVAINEGALEVI